MKRVIGKIIIYMLGAQIVLGAAFVPQVFFVELDRSATEELTVINNSNSPIRYSVSIVPEDGDTWKGYELKPEWVRFYPRVVSVAPMSRGVVRFRVNAPDNIADGEYRGNILLEEMKAKNQGPIVEDELTTTSIAMGIQKNFMLAIYSHKGEKEYKADISEISKIFTGDEALLKMELENIGNITLRPKIEVSYLDDRGRAIEERDIFLEVTPPNTKREYSRSMTEELARLPKGTTSIRYEVYHYDLNGQENVIKLFESEQSL